MRFIGNTFELTTRRIIAEYPDYKVIIPKHTGDKT
jgi:DNA polymerase III sliding clamp (beta) subunit (PCNA family)